MRNQKLSYICLSILLASHKGYAMEPFHAQQNRQKEISFIEDVMLQKKVATNAAFNVLCQETQESLLSELQLHIASDMMQPFLQSTATEIREHKQIGDDSHGKLLFAEISRNGKWLVTVDNANKRSAYVWDMATAQLKHTLSYASVVDEYTDDDTIISLFISPDSKFVVIGSEDMMTKIWDIVTGGLEHVLPVCDGLMNLMVISDDGKDLITVSGLREGHNSLQIWDMQTAEPLNFLHYTGSHCITSLRINRACNQIAISSCEPSLSVWDVSGRNNIRTLVEQPPLFKCPDIMVTCDDNYIIFAREQEVRLWSIKTGQEYTLKTYDSWIKSLYVLSGTAELMVVTADGLVEIWDMNTIQYIRSCNSGRICCVYTLFAWDEYGKKFLKTMANRVFVHDIVADKVCYELWGHADEISVLKTNAQGTHVVTSGSGIIKNDTTVKLWALEKSDARLWLEREVLPFQANLIMRAYTATQTKQDFAITSGTDDMWIWLSLPDYVRNYLQLYLNISLVAQSAQMHQ